MVVKGFVAPSLGCFYSMFHHDLIVVTVVVPFFVGDKVDLFDVVKCREVQPLCCFYSQVNLSSGTVTAGVLFFA